MTWKIQMAWKIQRAQEDTVYLEELLNEGWQPFAVISKVDYASPWVYLRREFPNALQNPDIKGVKQ